VCEALSYEFMRPSAARVSTRARARTHTHTHLGLKASVSNTFRAATSSYVFFPGDPKKRNPKKNKALSTTKDIRQIRKKLFFSFFGGPGTSEVALRKRRGNDSFFYSFKNESQPYHYGVIELLTQ
jgi:hypothetical protein